MHLTLRRLFLLAFGLSFLSGNAMAFQEDDLFIRKFLIDLYLRYKFPISKNLLIGKIILSDPNIKFNEEKQMVNLKVNYLIDFNKKEFGGDFEISSSVIYLQKEKIIKIQNPRIENLSLTDKAFSRDSIFTLNSILINTVDGLIIYKIEDNFLYKSSYPKDIVLLENGVLVKY